MPASQLPLSAIQTAVHDVMHSLTQQARPPLAWSEFNEDALWRELVGCILGSRVRYATAYAAIERLADAGLLSAPHGCGKLNRYEQSTEKVLASSPTPHPFSRAKAKQMRGAAEYIYASGRSLHGMLSSSAAPRDIRRALASDVPGIGPKQASLFLRNVGFADNLAVLDTHVLTYMQWFQLTDEACVSVPNVERYEILEDALIQHSRALGHSPDRFDVAVWVVVRTARREFANGIGNACIGRI